MTPGRVLAVGGALVALALVLVATHSSYRVTGSNFTSRDAFVAVIPGGAAACQDGESVPRYSGRVELRIGTYDRAGPPLRVEIIKDGRRLATGRRAAGWQQGDVQIPMAPELERTPGSRLCLHNEGRDRVAVAGQLSTDPPFVARIGEAPALGRLRIDYYTGTKESLASTSGRIWHNFGIGKARVLGGRWTLVVAALALLAAFALAGSAVVRAPARPRSIALTCGGVALCSAVAWSLVTPPLHVPDEIAHYAYAQHLAETGKLPVDQPGDNLAPDSGAVTAALNFFAVISDPHDKPIRAPEEQANLRQAEDRDLPARGDGEALSATANPPLYYLAQAAVYKASPWQDLLDRLVLMRLLGALLAAATAAVVALFALEVLPRTPIAGLAAGLAAALQPLFGFISSGVNNDGLLYLCGALLFYALARAFRRGLDVRAGVLVGVVLAAGLLTKLSFQALVPGALVALALLVVRGRFGRPSLLGAAAAVGLGYLPYKAFRVLEPHWRTDLVGPPDAIARGDGTRMEMLSYVWQLYLPRPDFLTDLIPAFPAYNLWFVGWMGRFGWLDYTFPGWVNQLALIPAAGAAALVAIALVRERAALRRRLAELTAYAAIVAAFLFAVGYIAYYFQEDTGQQFAQARYLLPLLALYGLSVATAVRACGTRASSLLAGVVVLAAAHTLFSQVITLERYFA